MPKNLVQNLLLACIFLLTGCGHDSSPSVDTLSFLAMGTTVSISVAGPTPDTLTETLGAVEARMQELGREWYPWTPDGSGELARLNAAFAAGETLEVSTELAALLAEAKALAAASGGRFDPAVGALVELWGFADGIPDDVSLPDPRQIEEWAQQRPTYADLVIEGRQVGSRHSALKLDLGAIAKGHIVDLATMQLKTQGIVNALIVAGGHVRALGSAPERAWRVAIQDPRRPDALGWIELADGESVDTSGDYERYAESAGRRIHHLLDPRTGQPPAHTAAITVVAASGTLADAAATALFIAGPDEWQQVARDLGIRSVLRVDTSGHMEITHAMAERLHWEEGYETTENVDVVDL